MRFRPHSRALIGAIAVAMTMALVGCGAGSRTGAQTATEVQCDFENPAEPTTINVLAYNSSAVDPFTNTMVKSCTKENVTVKHDPIDFAGQVQKTTATLAGDKGTYDIIETYGFIIGPNAAAQKLQPLDDLYAKYSAEYGLDQIDESMRKGMSYEGKLYGLPMQAQMFVMAYRKDVFDKHGLSAPKTFEELRAAGKKIQDAGDMKYPIALPYLATGDIATHYQATLNSLGSDYVDPKTKEPQLDTPTSKQAFEEMKSLLPYMDPQVTTFDQPKVQQQLFNGTAAIAVMFSGRMNDLTQEQNSKYFDKFAFAAPPAVESGGPLYSRLSIDGWSLPANTDKSPDLLFELIASSVSEEASKASIPAAFPARKGMMTEASSPYAAAAMESIEGTTPPESYPYTPDVSNAVISLIAQTVLGKLSIDEGTAQMQAAAEKVMAKY
ncbi:MAG TPA: extracellular solute-binding protein [Propionibacteriaceae bacterium]|nr:eltP 1 [Propionibacteriaceae bacterium]HJQ86271.1 extracellular solute-binding protein [Propionibacteriaceae bacterium]